MDVSDFHNVSWLALHVRHGCFHYAGLLGPTHAGGGHKLIGSVKYTTKKTVLLDGEPK